MAQVQVITGPQRYRAWTLEQKQALVARAFAPGAVVTDVAREADVSASLLYRWRRDFRGDSGFARVVVTRPEGSSGGEPTDAAIELDFPGLARARIASSAPPALAIAVVKALARRGT